MAQPIPEKHYRHIVALAFTGIFGTVTALALFLYGLDGLQLSTAILGPMEGLILGFYFGGPSK